MTNSPDQDIRTPAYVPLNRKVEYWGDLCEPSELCEGPEFICMYSQNVNRISDQPGMLYDQDFYT